MLPASPGSNDLFITVLQHTSPDIFMSSVSNIQVVPSSAPSWFMNGYKVMTCMFINDQFNGLLQLFVKVEEEVSMVTALKLYL